MSRRRLGISIFRREACLAGLIRHGGKGSVAVKLRAPRPAGRSVEETISVLLEPLPSAWRACDVYVALSPCDLACADCCEAPYRSERRIEAVAGSLAEGRCAGEAAEQLAVDFIRIAGAGKGSRIEMLAIRRERLERLRKALIESLPAARLQLVTSIPSAVAASMAAKDGVAGFAFDAAGEGLAIRKESGRPAAWRSFPLDTGAEEAVEKVRSAAFSMGPVKEETVTCTGEGARSLVELAGGLQIELPFAAAAAAALANPAHGANLLRGARDAPRKLLSKVRGPLRAALGAASILLLAAGLLFEQRKARNEADGRRAEALARRLWEAAFPGRPAGDGKGGSGNGVFRPGRLLVRMRRRLAEYDKARAANRLPSALSFWSEIGQVMPEPDPMGLRLEALYLGPDGGRMSGRVRAAPNDPLRHAARLENALNESAFLVARGEFERHGEQVGFRMRLDYTPPASLMPRGAR